MSMERERRGGEETESRERVLTGEGWRGVGWMLAAALLAGLLLRLWFMLRYAWITGDALVYGDIARNVLEHHVYGFSETLNGVAAKPSPTLIRLPGYPLFLAACFRVFGVGNYTAVLLVQIVVDLWACLLLGGVAARIFGQRAGVAAVWLGALCPFTANYTAAPLTETLTLFCMGLAFYAIARWSGGVDRWVLLMGFALAYAILLRPEQGLLGAAVLPAMLWVGWRAEGLRLRAWSPVLVVAVLTVLPLGPWALRNWRTFHVVQPLAPRYATDPGETNPYGFQRWYRTWAIEFASTEDVYWNYEGSPINVGDLPNRAFDSQAEYSATASLLADYDQNNSATPALDRRFDAIAAERIHADPLRYYVVLPVARVLDMTLRPRVEMLPVPLEWWKFAEHRKACSFAAGYAFLNLGYLVLAGAELARRWAWRGQEALVWSMVATVCLRAALLLTLDNSEARYTLEFFPVLIVLGAGMWATSRRACL